MVFALGTVHRCVVEQFVASLEPWHLYLLVAAITFGESALFLSLLIPGEVGLVAAAALGSAGGVEWFPLTLVASLGAAIGGLVGYEFSRRHRERVMAWRPFAGSAQPQLARLGSRMARGSSVVVVVSRFNQVSRALVPALAGLAEMERRRFLWANSLGAVLWAGTFTALGFLAAEWWARSSTPLHVGLAVAIALAIGLWVFRVSRRTETPG